MGSAGVFARDVGQGLLEVSHNTLALLGLLAVATALFVGGRADLRQSVETQALDWLQARQDARTDPADLLAAELSEPGAVARATAADPKDLTRQQANVARWISRRYRVAPEPISRLVKEAIGGAPPQLVGTYRLLCGLSSHDLSAMRELLGMPRRVIAARQWGSFLTALFEYENFTVSFETGIDHNRRFDAHLTVYSETKEIRVQYDTPYIRQLPTRLFINETQGEAFEERELRPTFTDAYTVELLHFHEVVSQNLQPKTTAEDFLNDLDLFEMIIDALRE